MKWRRAYGQYILKIKIKLRLPIALFIQVEKYAHTIFYNTMAQSIYPQTRCHPWRAKKVSKDIAPSPATTINNRLIIQIGGCGRECHITKKIPLIMRPRQNIWGINRYVGSVIFYVFFHFASSKMKEHIKYDLTWFNVNKEYCRFKFVKLLIQDFIDLL